MWRAKNLWASEGVGSPTTAVLGLAISPGGVWSRTLYAATTSGVYRSTDEGLTWKLMGDGLGTTPTVAVVLSPTYAQDGRVYALTLGGTVYVARG
jgi:hypothetical protein